MFPGGHARDTAEPLKERIMRTGVIAKKMGMTRLFQETAVTFP